MKHSYNSLITQHQEREKTKKITLFSTHTNAFKGTTAKGREDPTNGKMPYRYITKYFQNWDVRVAKSHASGRNQIGRLVSKKLTRTMLISQQCCLA